MVKEIRFCKFKRLVVRTKGKFGTGEGLLGYGICARCKKQAPGVRGAFSEVFGVKNRLLWYAAHFHQGHSVRRTGFWGTEGIFGTRNPLLRYGVHLHSAHNKKKDAEKLHPHNQFTQAIKPQLFDFDTTRSRNFLLLNTLRQRNVKHTVHHLSLNGIKVNVLRKSKALMV